VVAGKPTLANLQNAEGVEKPNIVGKNARAQLGVKVIGFGVARRTWMKMDTKRARGIMTVIIIEMGMRGMEMWKRNHKEPEVMVVGQEGSEEIDGTGKETETEEMMEQIRFCLRLQPRPRPSHPIGV